MSWVYVPHSEAMLHLRFVRLCLVGVHVRVRVGVPSLVGLSSALGRVHRGNAEHRWGAHGCAW